MSEEYIDENEVQEVIDETNEPEPIENDDAQLSSGVDGQNNEDEDMEMDTQEDEVIEVDMSNNSWGYFDQHKDSVFKIAGHPKLPVVLTGGGDNVGYIWTTHLQTPKLISTITGHTESVIAGGFTSDGNFAVTGDMNGKVIITKAFKKGQVWKFMEEIEQVDEIIWIEMHPKEPIFAFGATDGSVWVYQIEQEGPATQLMSGFSHSTECTNGKFLDALDSLTLITCSEDSSVVQWNCFTGEQVYKLQSSDFRGEVPPWVSLVVNSEMHVAVLGSRDGTLVVYNTSNGKIVDYFRAIELNPEQDFFEASIEALAWCQKITVLAVGLVSGDVFFFDTKTWKLRKALKYEDAITKMEFVGGSELLVISCLNGKIYELDVRTGEELFVGVGHNMGILDFVAQENGKRLITAGDEGVSLIFNIGGQS